MKVATVGVVGAGTMGSGIAQSFAQAGFTVRLVDVSPQMLARARGSIEKSLTKFVEKGTLPAAEKDAALARLSAHTVMSDLSDVDYVVEAIVEDAEAKRALFRELDALTPPRTILASNTSSIPIA